MENFIRDYWPQLIFAGCTLIGFGKGWQLFNIMIKTLETHSIKLETQSQKIETIQTSLQVDFCKQADCEKYRGSCAARNDKRFDEIRDLLTAMDNKRENSRDALTEALSTVACEMSQIKGKMEALHNGRS